MKAFAIQFAVTFQGTAKVQFRYEKSKICEILTFIMVQNYRQFKHNSTSRTVIHNCSVFFKIIIAINNLSKFNYDGYTLDMAKKYIILYDLIAG